MINMEITREQLLNLIKEALKPKKKEKKKDDGFDPDAAYNKRLARGKKDQRKLSSLGIKKYNSKTVPQPWNDPNYVEEAPVKTWNTLSSKNKRKVLILKKLVADLETIKPYLPIAFGEKVVSDTVSWKLDEVLRIALDYIDSIENHPEDFQK